MMLQPFDFFVQSSPPQYCSDLSFNHKLYNGCSNIETEAHSAENKQYGKHPPREANLMHFIETDGGNGYHRHVEGINLADHIRSLSPPQAKGLHSLFQFRLDSARVGGYHNHGT